MRASLAFSWSTAIDISDSVGIGTFHSYWWLQLITCSMYGCETDRGQVKLLLAFTGGIRSSRLKAQTTAGSGALSDTEQGPRRARVPLPSFGVALLAL